jgi:hypothetical protein
MLGYASPFGDGNLAFSKRTVRLVGYSRLLEGRAVLAPSSSLLRLVGLEMMNRGRRLIVFCSRSRKCNGSRVIASRL